MDYLVNVLLFICGIMVGFLLRSWLVARFTEYSGTIVVDKDNLREKTVYTLELDEYPEKLEFKKTVIFRVDNPE